MYVRSAHLLSSGILLMGFVFNAQHAVAQLGNGDCDRACLESFVDRYLDAVIDNEPAAVPLADLVRFTENGQRLAIGDGLWNTMKAKGSYRLFVADVPAGQVGFIGTIEEDHRDPAQSNGALLALRLRIENDEITEIEQFVARDAGAWERVSAMGEPRGAFAEAIPRRERMSRADLIATANTYFTGMQQNDGKGDYPFSSACDRFENGMHATNAATQKITPLSGPAPSSSSRDYCTSCTGFAIVASWPSTKNEASFSVSYFSIIRAGPRAISRRPTGVPLRRVRRSRGPVTSPSCSK
jgi:hypothetical protein